MLAKLAWRNVLRNRRRSAITVLSIAVGLAALTFIWAPRVRHETPAFDPKSALHRIQINSLARKSMKLL